MVLVAVAPGCFPHLKKCLTCPPALSYYSVDKPVTLTCEPSQHMYMSMEENTFEVMNVCNVSPSRMDELKRPTDDDVTLQMLVNTIRQGWPTKLHSLPPAM